MAPSSSLNPESQDFNVAQPTFFLGQHDTSRSETLTDAQYNSVLRAGFSFVTTPVSNSNFKRLVRGVYEGHLKDLQRWEKGLLPSEAKNPSLPTPTVPTLTNKDTSLFPSTYVSSLVAVTSSWTDLCSPDPVVANISRQVLNIEVAYANFCGVRSIVIPGPQTDEDRSVAQYARAVKEALQIATRISFIIDIPMYREPLPKASKDPEDGQVFSNADRSLESQNSEIDLFSSWDTWHTIRTVCEYTPRLFVALQIPRRIPEKELQGRWFAEPLHFLTLDAHVFQANRAGHPSLSKTHQDLLNTYLRLKNTPWFLLSNVGPDGKWLDRVESGVTAFPSLAEASQMNKPSSPQQNAYVSYMRYLERQQPPFTAMETVALTSFQDWLQSPLQPLSDNLESATYEMFEGDPVKYDQYEAAITEAMREWKALRKPTSSGHAVGEAGAELVVTVAGAGRGPLVTRALRAAAKTGTPIHMWAVEKNQNAYVYLLRQNEKVWDNKVTIVKTDMRDWEGPRSRNSEQLIKVDILITELLGSFGDNELSPECLDGIQKHLARPHGISIPQSYTAHLSPISTPRIHADLLGRLMGDPNAFQTPWVVRLFAIDYLAQKTPDHRRFQQAWEFAHPVAVLRGENAPRTRTGTAAGAGGSMYGAGGSNEHNTRHCHLTFVCRSRGVVHGLAGYFESTLYEPLQTEVGLDGEPGNKKDLIEISILPDQIDRKSKDMISWFPIFFPLKTPLYFPQDTELEVSMWRQTDDTRVWYEWLVEAFAWVGPTSRVKVGASELHSSRDVACLM